MISADPSNQNSLLPVTYKTDHRLYPKRWFILFLYILYAAVNAFQWFEYSIIANIIMRFYQVSPVEVDWTSIIYSALYMPMVIPASCLMQKLNLRQTALIGVWGTTLGTTIKIFSLSSDRIWVAYLAQTILSSMQVFILALPPQIASVWFGPQEVSLACALGVFGTQLGQALGFILPPMVVKNHEKLEDVASDLSRLIYGLAIFSLIVTAAVSVSRPATPPKEITESGDANFLQTLKNLLKDKSFNFLAIAYGINIGVFVSISTLLNQFMLFYFEESEEDAGRLGLLMIVLGMMGAIAFGFILDKTHAYKNTTLVMYISSLIALTAFMFALDFRSKISVYVSGALFGLFTNAYMPVGMELAIELTHPEPENTSSGILISMTQAIGVIFTLLLGWLFAKIGCFWALAVMSGCLLVGAIFTSLISNVTKRQNAFRIQ